MTNTNQINQLTYVRPVFHVEIMNSDRTLIIRCERTEDAADLGPGGSKFKVSIAGTPDGAEPPPWNQWDFPVTPDIPEILGGAIQELKNQLETEEKSYYEHPKETSFFVCSWLSIGWVQTAEMYWGFLEFSSEGRSMRADVCDVEVMEDFATVIAQGMTGA